MDRIGRIDETVLLFVSVRVVFSQPILSILSIDVRIVIRGQALRGH